MHLWHPFFTSILIIEMRRMSQIMTACINCKDLLKFCLNFSKTSKVLHQSLQMTVTSSSQKPPLSSSHKIHSHGTDDTFQSLMVDSKWQTEAVKVALVAGLLYLQGCLPALAENLSLDVARSDQPIGFMSDVGDFQSGFTSVCTRSLLHFRTLAWIQGVGF